MKALENRKTDSKREMDDLDSLQDIQNARNNRIDPKRLQEILDTQIEVPNEADEEQVHQNFPKIPSSIGSDQGDAAEGKAGQPPMLTVKRKADGTEPELSSLLSEVNRAALQKTSLNAPTKRKKNDLAGALGIKVVKKAKV